MISILTLLPHFVAAAVVNSSVAPIPIADLVNPQASAWRKSSVDDGVTVWSRQLPHSDIEQIRAEVTIATPVNQVWQVMYDVKRYPELIPDLASATVIAKEGLWTEYVYQRLDPPLVRNRDYTLKMVSLVRPEDGYYQRTFHTANDRGPPPSPDLVRLAICDGGWQLQAVAQNATHVTYWIHTDPAISAPPWFTNKANRDAITQFLKAVRQRSTAPLPKLTQQ